MTQAAVLKDVQRHPAKNAVLHVDLQRVLENEKIRIAIPLHFKGDAAAPGVKKGGVVSHLRNEVEVLCLPKDLPEFVDVDLSGLDMNQMLYLADLKLPEGVEIPELTHGRNAPVVSIHHARAEEVETPTAEAAAAARCGGSGCGGGSGGCGGEAGGRGQGRTPRSNRPPGRATRAALAGGPCFSGIPPWLARRCRSSSGLGNPGPEHRLTRHNAGFWFVDALARAQADGVPLALALPRRGLPRARSTAATSTLLKPQTYMNRSGLSIRALLDYVKAPVSELLVVHDELDLAPGTARFKLGGGHGGHNGLRDTITHCGADFWRLRLGIGHPGDRSEVIDYVLQRAAPADEDAIVASLSASLEALTVFVRDGAEKAMKQLHTRQVTRDRR